MRSPPPAAACMLVLAAVAAAHAVAGGAPPAPAPGAHRPQLDKGVLLIANRGLLDPNFRRSVILITRYDEQGTVGIVINRPLQLPASDALPSLDGLAPDAGNLHMGGPVATSALQLLIESEAALDPDTHVFDRVHMVQEAGILEQLRSGRVVAAHLRLFAGYAGWAAGQLESELLRGDWYLWPADPGIVFTAHPEAVWTELMERVSARWVLRGSGRWPRNHELWREIVAAVYN